MPALSIILPHMSKAHVSPDDSMKELLEKFPSVRRTLFAEYHIGGCSSCAYQDDETLTEVCIRNEIDIESAIVKIIDSHEADKAMLITCKELKKRREEEKILIIDSRTREEFEAVSIPNSIFLTQELQTEIFAKTNSNELIIIIDHTGKNSLDTCAWFRGHGVKNTYALMGGIDSYSQEIDSSIARYKLELS